MSVISGIIGSSILQNNGVLYEWDMNNYALTNYDITSYPNNLIGETFPLTVNSSVTVDGPTTWNDSSTGYTLNFNGGYVQTPQLDTYTVWSRKSTGFTVELWFYPTAISTTLLSIADDPMAPVYYYSMLEINGSGELLSSIYTGSGLSTQNCGLVNLNQWNHVSVRYNIATNTFNTSINNVTYNTSTTGWSTPWYSGTGISFNLGLATITHADNGNNFIGQIGLVRIFNFDTNYNGYVYNEARYITPPSLPTSNLILELDAAHEPSNRMSVFFPNDNAGLNLSPGAITGGQSDNGYTPWTVECWFKMDNDPSSWTHAIIGCSTGSYGLTIFTGQYGSSFTPTNSNITVFLGGGYSTWTVPAMTTNTWYHLAVVRDNSGNGKIWLNGVAATLSGNPTFYSTLTTPSDQVGYWHNNSYNSGVHLVGDIYNLRILSNTNLYDTSLSTIPVPTTPFTVIPDTSLLLISNENGFTDLSNTSTISQYGTGSDTVTTGQSIPLEYNWNDISGQNNSAVFNQYSELKSGEYGTYTFVSGKQVFTVNGYYKFILNNTWANAGSILPYGSYSKTVIFNLSDVNSYNLVSGQNTAFTLTGPYNPYLEAGNNGSWSSVVSTSQILTNHWYIATVTYDDSTKNWCLYINGSQVATNTMDDGAYTSPEPIQIGAFQSNASFGGNISVVLVHSSALSENNAIDIFNYYRGRFAL